jgi:UDP-N-acetylmuramoylalanine-D-glutamate ligase
MEIISEIELAYRFKGNSKIIGITGSNGKTTTTALHIISAKQQALIVQWLATSVFHLQDKLQQIPNRCM